MLNLFVALIINSMQSLHAFDREAAAAVAPLEYDERVSIEEKFASLRDGVRQPRDMQWQG